MEIKLTVADGNGVQCFILETMGAFFLVFMYLSSTEEKTKFTKDAAVQTIILAGSYLGSMLLAGAKIKGLAASPVNPAISLAIVFFNSTSETWRTLPIFLVGAPIGGMISLIFFRFVYQRTADAIEDIEDAESHNENALLEDD